MKRTAARRWIAAAAPARELNDHAGTVLAHTLLHLSEERRIGRGAFIRIAHVDMDERGSRLKSLMCRFDLLGRRDRDGGIILLARNGSGNRDCNDHRPHRTFLLPHIWLESV